LLLLSRYFVIASEAKQSILPQLKLDCFVAEFIIGRAFRATRWLLAMTARVALAYFFTSGQRDNSSDWNASLPGTVASSL
jgi:hypothetical protein